MTIAMDEVLLRELKRVAQEEGIPVHKLVAEIIVSHLGGSKATATTGDVTDLMSFPWDILNSNFRYLNGRGGIKLPLATLPARTTHRSHHWHRDDPPAL